MSTTRINHCLTDELAAQEASRDNQYENNRDYIGYVYALAREIRITRDERQAFAIYDTALGPVGTERAHSDVCQAVLRPGSKAIELRRILQEIFSERGLMTTRGARQQISGDG
jgi:hypothetical protein